MNCPECNSHKVRSYDNECLYHPSPEDTSNYTFQHDTEIYILFTCDECDHNFTKVFNLIPQQ